jgi:hypothetical protein
MYACILYRPWCWVSMMSYRRSPCLNTTHASSTVRSHNLPSLLPSPLLPPHPGPLPVTHQTQCSRHLNHINCVHSCIWAMHSCLIHNVSPMQTWLCMPMCKQCVPMQHKEDTGQYTCIWTARMLGWRSAGCCLDVLPYERACFCHVLNLQSPQAPHAPLLAAPTLHRLVDLLREPSVQGAVATAAASVLAHCCTNSEEVSLIAGLHFLCMPQVAS